MQRHPSALAQFPLVGYLTCGWLVATALTASLPGQAQVIPDATLGAGNNSVTSTTGNRTDILGGLRRNSSLFHSFEPPQALSSVTFPTGAQ